MKLFIIMTAIFQLNDAVDEESFEEAVAGLEDLITLAGLWLLTRSFLFKEDLVKRLCQFVVLDRTASVRMQYVCTREAA